MQISENLSSQCGCLKEEMEKEAGRELAGDVGCRPRVAEHGNEVSMCSAGAGARRGSLAGFISRGTAVSLFSSSQRHRLLPPTAGEVR